MTRRALPQVFVIVFAAVFAVAYLVAVLKNYALFTYHPATGRVGAGVERAGEGPAMYWYGWIATAALAGVAAGLAACLVPGRLAQRLWPGWAWLVPVCVVLAFCYLLRNYFLR
jgi:hypothetical protein